MTTERKEKKRLLQQIASFTRKPKTQKSWKEVVEVVVVAGCCCCGEEARKQAREGRERKEEGRNAGEMMSAAATYFFLFLFLFVWFVSRFLFFRVGPRLFSKKPRRKGMEECPLFRFLLVVWLYDV